MSNDLDVGCGEMGVGLDKVSSKNTSKELGGSNWMFLGFDVNCVLHGIGCNHNTVIGLGISRDWLALDFRGIQ